MASVPLSAGFPERMVILDCETTGLKATYHRILEIGLLVVEQGEVVERWQQFINPESHIPPEIQRLTGITPDRVVRAPVFADIAEALLSKLEGRVLVAHNARFDYGFLKNEFSRLGINYSTKPLCSVKLSRQLFPQYKRHSLNALIQRFHFNIENRHRAQDDAAIIWQFMLKASALFSAEEITAACAQILQRPALPMNLAAAAIDALPKTPGVYYFYDAKDKLLYVGKSVNIRARVMSHFTQDYRNAKDLAMSALIARIDFDTTPSDFGAQLLESQQIKALSPYYNRRLRKVMKLYQFQLEPDADGYLRVKIRLLEQAADSNMQEQFGLFRSRRQAEARLGKLAEYYFLCHKLCGLQAHDRAGNKEPCFAYQLKRCLGACCQQETAEAYNERVQLAFKEYRYRAWPWPDAILVKEQGQQGQAKDADTPNQAWHLVHEWRYITQIHSEAELYDRGYGFADDADAVMGLRALDRPPLAEANPINFDLDIYLILVRFLLDEEQMALHGLQVVPLQSL